VLSFSSFAFAMAQNGHEAHSTLESIIHQRHQHNGQLLEDPGMQVVPEDEKQVKVNDTGLEVDNTGIEVDDTGIEVVPKNDLYNQPFDRYHKSSNSRRKWLIIGGVATLMIVVGVIVGGVLGSMSKDNKSDIVATTSPSPSPSVSAAAAIHYQSKIAAISYASDSVNYTRVYYQDNTGEIVEATNSAENSTWDSSGLGFFGQNGSALAAAVSPPGFPFVSFLFMYSAISL